MRAGALVLLGVICFPSLSLATPNEISEDKNTIFISIKSQLWTEDHEVTKLDIEGLKYKWKKIAESYWNNQTFKVENKTVHFSRRLRGSRSRSPHESRRFFDAKTAIILSSYRNGQNLVPENEEFLSGPKEWCASYGLPGDTPGLMSQYNLEIKNIISIGLLAL